jgi:hypothetical protein
LKKNGSNSKRNDNSRSLERLAEFFPQAIRIRIPVRVTRAGSPDGPEVAGANEAVIEYGTAEEVLFEAAEPLEFAERIRLKNHDGSLDAEASVVAVQFHEGSTAVAARFTGKVANWIIQK